MLATLPKLDDPSRAYHVNDIGMLDDLISLNQTGYLKSRTGTIQISVHNKEMQPVHRYLVSRHYRPNLRINTGLNYFFCPNSFNFHLKKHYDWRTLHYDNAHIGGLNAFWLDLDTDGHKSVDSDIDPRKFFILYLDMVLGEAGFPRPTFTDLSGHGLHLYWFFDHQVQVNDWKRVDAGDHEKWHSNVMWIWRATIQAIVKRFNAACVHLGLPEVADGNCTNPSRLLRLPLSLNNKKSNGYYSPRVWTVDRNPESRMDMFQEFRKLVGRKPYVRRSRRRNMTPKAKPRRKTGRRETFGIATGSSARLQDAYKLVQMRNDAGEYTGYRHALLAFIADECHFIMSTAQTWSYLQRFNQHFAEPIGDLQKFDPEVKFQGTIDRYEHRYHTSTVIRKVHIKFKEQKHLHVLRSKFFRKFNLRNDRIRRNAKRRAETGFQIYKHERAKTVRVMRKMGLACDAIAVQIHTSVRTVYRIIHAQALQTA